MNKRTLFTLRHIQTKNPIHKITQFGKRNYNEGGSGLIFYKRHLCLLMYCPAGCETDGVGLDFKTSLSGIEIEIRKQRGKTLWSRICPFQLIFYYCKLLNVHGSEIICLQRKLQSVHTGPVYIYMAYKQRSCCRMYRLNGIHFNKPVTLVIASFPFALVHQL